MKRILAFSGSNHSKSINQQLVVYTASLMKDMQGDVLSGLLLEELHEKISIFLESVMVTN